MWSLLGVCPYLIRDPVPKCDDFRMVAISRSVDEVVAPLDVQFRFREWGDETPLHEVLGYQDTSPSATPTPRIAASMDMLPWL